MLRKGTSRRSASASRRLLDPVPLKETAMRHLDRPLALLLASSLSLPGCATAHLGGDYYPQSPASNTTRETTGHKDKQNLAEGHDWVLFWGLIELASSDLGEAAKKDLRNDEVIQDVEVRNHLSLPGALLWVVTLGLVSHHDLVLRGEVATLKTVESKAAESKTAESKTMEPSAISDRDRYSETVIDRPIDEVAMSFDKSARDAGLIPLDDIRWDRLSDSKKSELRGDVPPDRLERAFDSKIHTFIVTNNSMVNDVQSDPRCGAFIPSILCYEKDGKTNVFYTKPSAKLRELDSTGGVGEGKTMSRASYDEHMSKARDFEKSCDSLVRSLSAAPRSAPKE
jgi:hypothetical protein